MRDAPLQFGSPCDAGVGTFGVGLLQAAQELLGRRGAIGRGQAQQFVELAGTRRHGTRVRRPRRSDNWDLGDAWRTGRPERRPLRSLRHDWEPSVPFRAPSLGDVCLRSASGSGCFATGSSVTQGAISSISFTTPSGNGRVLRVIATSTISGQVVEFARLLMVPTTREQCQMLPK